MPGNCLLLLDKPCSCKSFKTLQTPAMFLLRGKQPYQHKDTFSGYMSMNVFIASNARSQISMTQWFLS